MLLPIIARYSSLLSTHYLLLTTLHTTHYTLHTTYYTLHIIHYTLHTTHHTLHTIADILVYTVRVAIALVQHNNDCPTQLAAIRLLKDYIDNLPATPIYIVTSSVLCFKNANDRRRYRETPTTSVQTVIRPALQYLLVNILRLFLCASQYQTTSIANTPDQQHYILVIKLEQHQHIYTTSRVNKEGITQGVTRIINLRGMAVVQFLLRSYQSRQRATVYVRDRGNRRCVADSLEVVADIFEATVIYRLVGSEIVDYIMQGRTAVDISLQRDIREYIHRQVQ